MPDGHWPQNMWVSGATYWDGIQLGETVLPILLVDLLRWPIGNDGDIPGVLDVEAIARPFEGWFGGLDEVMIKLAGKIGKYGGQTSHIFANPESLSDLELISNSKIRIMGSLTTNLRSDTTGDIIVGFSGYNFVSDDVVAKGWLRLSHRELDETRSTETRPVFVS